MAEDEDGDWIPVMTTRAWVFADRLRAADIAGASGVAFAPLDAELAGQIRPGDVIVAGSELGCGDGADGAVRALRAVGIVAVIAVSFAQPFAAAALAAGLPAIAVDEIRSVRTGDRLRVDIEGRRIVNLSAGDRFPIRGLDDATLAAWRAALARGS